MKEACNSCLNFQEELFKTISSSPDYGFGKAEHVVEYRDILQSSAKGCASCTVMRKAIVALETPNIPDDTKITLGIFEKGYPHPPDQPRFFAISFDCDNPLRTRYDNRIELYSSSDVPTPWGLIGWKGCRTVEDDSSSPACIDLARLWIEECISSHPCCHAPKSPLPRRVVDVGSDEVEPRLYLPQKEEIVPYTALSYCWGDFRHITTTKDTLKQRLLGIPISALPKTFNDAIVLTRRLGIQYIWIDSLCIIQDDNIDWTESAKMADIYSNTFVTICADEGKDARAGFLGRRGEGGLTSIKIPCPATADSKVESRYVYARNTVGLSMYPGNIQSTVPIGITHTGGGVSALNKRGWTFQERLLSPRTLNYTVAEMAFECKKYAVCECSRVPHFLGSDRVFKSQIPASYRNHDHMWRNWTDIVENLTQRSLGRETDRLVALSGVAAAMHPYTAEDYICGLWKMRFLEGLLWQVDEIKNSHRNSSYAPSWSWTSVTSPISYWHGAITSDEPDHWVELVSINIEKMSTNLYTQARGSATLRGYLGEETIIQGSPGQLYVNVDPDFEDASSSPHIPTLRGNDFPDPRALALRLDVDGQLEAKEADKVFVFIITIYYMKNSSDYQKHSPICLVLKRSVEEAPTVYFREGLAVPRWECHYRSWYRHFAVTEVRII